MMLSIKITGTVDKKFKNEQHVMEDIGKMFTNITIFELKQLHEAG